MGERKPSHYSLYRIIHSTSFVKSKIGIKIPLDRVEEWLKSKYITILYF